MRGKEKRKGLRETEKEENSWKRRERKEEKIFPFTKVPELTPTIHSS